MTVTTASLWNRDLAFRGLIADALARGPHPGASSGDRIGPRRHMSVSPVVLELINEAVGPFDVDPGHTVRAASFRDALAAKVGNGGELCRFAGPTPDAPDVVVRFGPGPAGARLLVVRESAIATSESSAGQNVDSSITTTVECDGAVDIPARCDVPEPPPIPPPELVALVREWQGARIEYRISPHGIHPRDNTDRWIRANEPLMSWDGPGPEPAEVEAKPVCPSHGPLAPAGDDWQCHRCQKLWNATFVADHPEEFTATPEVSTVMEYGVRWDDGKVDGGHTRGRAEAIGRHHASGTAVQRDVGPWVPVKEVPGG